MGDRAYSYSLTTFSDNGKLIQIEHALKCVQERGMLTVGVSSKNGVVLATTKKMSPLIDRSTFKKICPITKEIGMSYAGISPDFRVLVTKARKEAQIYYRKYQTEIPVLQLTRKVAEVMQEYTQSGGVRPFGVSLLIAGLDESGPQLYQADASGSYFQWKAAAIGQKFGKAKEFFEKRLFVADEVEDYETAMEEAIKCLRQENDEEVKPEDLEVGIMDKDGFRLVDIGELQKVVDNLNLK